MKVAARHGGRRWWLGQALLGLFALLLGGSAAQAQPDNRDRSINQFYHSRWTIKDGAPGQISALAQTRDGFIWLAAAATLYNFDGVRFERFESPDGLPVPSVQTLHAAPDGGLWLGFQAGGVAFLKDGKLTRYDEAQGLSVNQLMSFAVDMSGTVWAAGKTAGLLRLQDGRWHQVGEDWGFPDTQATALFVDRDGTLWAAAKDSLLFLPKGSHTFRPTGVRVGWVGRMAQAPDGTLWITELDGAGGVRPVVRANGEPLTAAARIAVTSAGMLFDREGSLWLSTLGEGMRRVPHPERLGGRYIEKLDPAAEAFTEEDGLSADYVWPLIQDREGNIWAGTSGGLDCFRHSTLVLAEFPRGSHDFALAAGDDGAVWAGSTNRPLMRLEDRQVHFTPLGAQAGCAYRDPDGIVWFGVERDIWRIENDVPVRVATLPEDVKALQLQALAKDGSGALWVATAGRALLRWKDGVWTRMDKATRESSQGLQSRLTSATTDAEGHVWLGYGDGTIGRVDDGGTRRHGGAEGFHLGMVTVLRAGRRFWVGGQFGLAWFDGEQLRRIGVAGPEPLRGVSGIVEMEDGGLWIHSVPGIFHLGPEEVARAVADPNHLARGEHFDFLDGLPARPTVLRPLPTLVRGTDGRLWFATSNGVVWVDPERIFRNPLPPPVVIRSVQADGRPLAPGPLLTLPVGAKNLELDYTGLSFTVPARVRFRYRLEGVDAEWQDVGTRREAYYTHLDPGRYRFQVIAANNDGVWNEAGATLELVVPPAWYQTWWFRALCVVVVLAVLWALYLLRLRQVRSHMRGLLEERHRERERIARELHDTLLQGIQGLILRFQSVAEQLPEGTHTRAALDKVLERADGVLVEGRDRVQDLRAAADNAEELSQALARVGEELQVGSAVCFRVEVEGEPTPLDALVRDEVYFIGREALANAFQHAGAKNIEVALTYGGTELCLRVRDDGRGLEPELLQAGGRPGHWGLAGMRERARKIGARLDIHNRGGAGAELELRMPASAAYPRDARSTWSQRLWRLVGGGR
ncbi:hypothetical protein JY651_17750 [Pyxidicoccus parkwayensis]|uniref:Histidine kinase/HSP90-like ATPase domain-containing protein n=1 Tax=Pyxidicoccus parkwayensis TaxID=2813578 RepID=A0ABX7P874_9BACT|nr:sensor histidine kinase [Pyxidicoccus parkwaysis]QSQ26658.1 hypothetical protein JY651_17750 [Pyxidicoccus parkwaysis]